MIDRLDWEAMETVGAGVKETRIRVETSDRELYVAKFSEAVYVLHAFVKKTQKTSNKDIDLSAERDKALIRSRNSKQYGLGAPAMGFVHLQRHVCNHLSLPLPWQPFLWA